MTFTFLTASYSIILTIAYAIIIYSVYGNPFAERYRDTTEGTRIYTLTVRATIATILLIFIFILSLHALLVMEVEVQGGRIF